MPDHIFISYRRDDAAYVTGHLNDLLREAFGPESVFTDVDNIALGVDFRQVLDESVSQCKVFLAVIGDHWLSVRNHDGRRRLEDPADFVRIEIESALRLNIPIIPLLVGHATMPQAEDLPESLRDFAFRNGTAIRPPPDFNTDVSRLIRGLRGYLQAAPAADAAEPKPAIQTDRRKTPRERISVEDEERARKQAELGIGQPRRQRRGALAAMAALVALAAGGWYYADRYPEHVQGLLAMAGIGAAATRPEAAAEATAGAPAVAVMDDRGDAPAADGSTAAVGVAPGAGAPDIPAATAVPGAAPGGAARDADSADDDAAADEVVLTPGTQRLADTAEYIREGVSLAAVGDHEAAIRYFDQVIGLEVEPAFAYRQRGASYQALGQFEAAVSDYDGAIELNGEDVIAWYNRGVSHLALGEYVSAVVDFDEVIRLDPEFSDAYSRRADAHDALGNAAQAAQDRATAGVFDARRNR